MQALIRSKSAGVTGGRSTAGAGPGRDLLYNMKRGGSARTAEKREAKKTNNTRREGPGHPGPETKKSKRQRSTRKTTTEKRSKKRKRGGGQTKDQERGKPSPEGAEQSRKTRQPKERERRTRTRPGGQPARPGQDGRAHTHTHGTRAWRRPTRKGRCRRPHKTAPVHQPSHPSIDGRYEKPDVSVTGSRHAKPPQRAQPKTDARETRQGQPHHGAPNGYDAEGAPRPCLSGRHNEPGFRQASACPAQPPSKAGGASPWGGERHHGIGKADQSTESDRTGRGAAHHAGPRRTPERHAAGHSQGERTVAKQQDPPDAANLESAHNTQRTTARGQVTAAAVRTDVCAPGSEASPCRPRNSRRLDGHVCARSVPCPCGLRTAAVQIDECAPGGYRDPVGYE